VADVRQPTPRDYDDEAGTLRVDLIVHVDPLRFQAAHRKLLAVLGLVSLSATPAVYTAKTSKTREIVIPGKSPVFREITKVETVDGFMNLSDKGFSRMTLPPEEKGWFLWMWVGSSADWSQTLWCAYRLDCDRGKSLRALQDVGRVKLSFLDKGGKVLTTDEVSLAGAGKTISSRWLLAVTETDGVLVPNVVVAPLNMGGPTGAGLYYKLAQPLRRDVRLSQEQLRRLKDIRCEVVFKED
jgi:hypothetical protein